MALNIQSLIASTATDLPYSGLYPSIDKNTFLLNDLRQTGTLASAGNSGVNVSGSTFNNLAGSNNVGVGSPLAGSILVDTGSTPGIAFGGSIYTANQCSAINYGSNWFSYSTSFLAWIWTKVPSDIGSGNQGMLFYRSNQDGALGVANISGWGIGINPLTSKITYAGGLENGGTGIMASPNTIALGTPHLLGLFMDFSEAASNSVSLTAYLDGIAIAQINAAGSELKNAGSLRLGNTQSGGNPIMAAGFKVPLLGIQKFPDRNMTAAQFMAAEWEANRLVFS